MARSCEGLTSRRRHKARQLRRGRNEQPHDLASQLIERRQFREGFDAVRIQCRCSDQATEDHEFGVILGIGHRHLRSSNRIARYGDAGWALEEMGDALRGRSLERAHRQTVLRHLERSPRRAHARTEVAHLGDRHAGIVGDDHGAGIAKHLIEALDEFRLPCSIHTRHLALLCNRRLRR